MRFLLSVVVWLSLLSPFQLHAQDGIDLTRAVFHGQNQVASWAAPVRITGVEFKQGTQEDRSVGVRLLFADTLAMRERWPYVTPKGWDGPIRFTVWMGKRINGAWHVLPAITMYDTAWGTGAPLPSRWKEWVYFDQAFLNSPPAIGEEMVFFASAGVARFDAPTFSVAERSNVARVILKETGVSPALGVIPEPQPEPQPQPTPAPDPGFGPRIAALEAVIQSLNDHIERLWSSMQDHRRELDAHAADIVELKARKIPLSCMAWGSIFRIPFGVRCELIYE